MASNHSSGGSRNDELVFIGLFFVLLFIANYILTRYSDSFVPVWRYLRSVELLVLMKYDAVVEMWMSMPRWGDTTFSNVNNAFYSTYRIFIAPFLILAAIAFYKIEKSTTDTDASYTFEKVLVKIHRRFAWLKETSEVKGSDSILENMIHPFQKVGDISYFDTDFREGDQPFQSVMKNGVEKTIIQLKENIGPRLKFDKDGEIVWQDIYAKQVYDQLVKELPNTKQFQMPLTMKEAALQRCRDKALYERTYVLHLLSEVKAFGVYSPAKFLWLRSLTGSKKNYLKNSDPFVLWRAILSHVRAPFIEAGVIMNQFHFENTMYQYIQDNPDKKEAAHSILRQSPRTREAELALLEIMEKYEKFKE